MPHRLARAEALEPRVLLAAQLVRDINAATDHAYTWNFTELNGVAYFAATDEAGRVLWRSDGTAEGTWLVKQIAGASTASLSPFTRAGDLIYFSVFGAGDSSGLWRSDGPAAGTTLLRTHDGQRFGADGATAFNGLVYFEGLGSEKRDIHICEGHRKCECPQSCSAVGA